MIPRENPRKGAPTTMLWIALVTVLVASWSHVAGAFGSLEHGGAPAFLASLGPFVGPLAALAVDVGLVALAWGVGARARSGEPSGDLWLGVLIFASLSALANFDHALAVVGGDVPAAEAWAALDRYTRVKVLALSATLPLLAIYLARVLETAAAGAPTLTEDSGAQPAQVEATPGIWARTLRVLGLAPGASAEGNAQVDGELPADGVEGNTGGQRIDQPPSSARAPGGQEQVTIVVPAQPSQNGHGPAIPLAPAHGRRASTQRPTRSHTRRSIRRRAHASDKPAALGAIIAHAAEWPEATVADLARAAGRPRQTVARWVVELSEAGALTRDADGRWVTARLPESPGADTVGRTIHVDP